MEVEKTQSDYINCFEQKHSISFDGWVGQEVGGVAMFGDFFFNYDDIRLDIDNKARKDLIFNWYDLVLEDNRSPNYETWLIMHKPKRYGSKK